jgi:hypothetical protein
MSSALSPRWGLFSLLVYPRLTPWAAFFRRFAAGNGHIPEMGIAAADVYFSGLYGCAAVWESRYVAESARPLRAAFFIGRFLGGWAGAS